MGRTDGKRMSRGKKLRFAILAAVLGLLVLEGGAWLIDLKTGFHGQVIRALERIKPEVGPVAAAKELTGPKDLMHVRSASGEVPLGGPYLIGGVLVPGVKSAPSSVAYRVADAQRDSRRKIFVVGGSVAFGFPFDYVESFSALLQERLDEREYLVLPAAQVGWTSGELVPLVGQIADRFSPSAVILLLGNNEWTHWTPPDQSAVSPVLLRIYRWFSWSRLASLGLYWRMKSWEKRQGEGLQEGSDRYDSHRQLRGYEYALMYPAREFDGEAWEKTRNAFLDNFGHNIRLMIQKARSSGARVIVCTMPFQYKLSPAWKHRQPLAYDAANRDQVAASLAQAAASLKRGDARKAIVALDKALVVEPKVPMLRHLKARALELSGKFLEAERWYGRARDAMVGNLGGVESLNNRLREIAREEGATLVDLRVEFDRHQHALGGFFNRDLIADDCHPTPEGQRVIAKALARALRAPARITSRDRER